MANNPIETAQKALAAFQAGDVGTASKLANEAMDQGQPFAQSITAKLHRVIGAGARAAVAEAKKPAKKPAKGKE